MLHKSQLILHYLEGFFTGIVGKIVLVEYGP